MSYLSNFRSSGSNDADRLAVAAMPGADYSFWLGRADTV